MMNLSVHRVTKIELVSKNDRNNNSRTIRIVTEDGEHELALFGVTHAVDGLPRAEDFADFANPTSALAAEKV